MAGVHFLFEDFEPLLRLNMGIADRLDENRAESFTLLYCDFSSISLEIINNGLEQVFRGSDSIISRDKDYYFVLPYTDKFGAAKVKEMFDEFFAMKIDSASVSYPCDGESPATLLRELEYQASKANQNDFGYLDSLLKK